MSTLVGTVIGTTGILLITSGLLLSRGLIAATGQSLLGLLLTVLGFVMTAYSGEGQGRFLAGLLGLLGVVLVVVGVVVLITGLPLYGGLGVALRMIVGIIFCVVSYLVYEFGRDISGDMDSF